MMSEFQAGGGCGAVNVALPAVGFELEEVKMWQKRLAATPNMGENPLSSSVLLLHIFIHKIIMVKIWEGTYQKEDTDQRIWDFFFFFFYSNKGNKEIKGYGLI